MAVIAFVHAVHGCGLRMRGRNNNWVGGQTTDYHQSKWGGNSSSKFHARCEKTSFLRMSFQPSMERRVQRH